MLNGVASTMCRCNQNHSWSHRTPPDPSNARATNIPTPPHLHQLHSIDHEKTSFYSYGFKAVGTNMK